MVFAYAAASPLGCQQSRVLLLFPNLHADTHLQIPEKISLPYSVDHNGQYRNSDFVCSGAHDIGEAENYLPEND